MAKLTVKQFSAEGIDISKERDRKIKVALSSPEAVNRFRDLVDSIFELHGKLSSEIKTFLEGKAKAYDVHRLDAEDILKNIFTTEVVMAKATEETERKQKEIALQLEERKRQSGSVEVLIHDRYRDHGDGTVTDIKTGLRWKRCAEGQTWNGTTCIGEAKKYKWKDLPSYDGWRPPTIEELKTLIYCSNTGKFGTKYKGDFKSPTIDQDVFPFKNIISSAFWSGSLNYYVNSPKIVIFYDGSDNFDFDKDAYYAVRLVI